MAILTGVLLGLCLGLGAPAAADPLKPYPNLARYVARDWQGFQVDDNPGVWFSTPTGMNCGIWMDGSFGCNGSLPGGGNQVGWFEGDDNVHVDNTNAPAFVAGVPQKPLLPNYYVLFRGAKCAVTPDSSVFCHSTSRHDFMISPGALWVEAQKRA